MTRSHSILTAATLGGLLTAYRAWHLHWGATQDETEAVMPGDEVVPHPHFCATRAMTIAAPPSCIWPWIVQIGFGRGGFYSYDLLDNLGRPSAETILPEFQQVRVGDLAAPMAASPTEETSFRVRAVEPFEHLVWEKPNSTWAWQLTRLSPHETRLVTRLRMRYDVARPERIAGILLMEIGDFPMMRRQLMGIRTRAEAMWRRDSHAGSVTVTDAADAADEGCLLGR